MWRPRLTILHPLWVDKKTRLLFAFALLLNLASWAFLLFRLWPFITQDRVVALHYSIYLGVDGVGSARMALVLPAICTGILIINACVAGVTYIRDRMAALVISLLTFVLMLGSFVASAYVILLNLKK